jgi:hypothetical protein
MPPNWLGGKNFPNSTIFTGQTRSVATGIKRPDTQQQESALVMTKYDRTPKD